MKKLDIYSYNGVTEEDNKAIVDSVKEGIELLVDENDKVWSEGGIYIADVVETEPGDGVGADRSRW